MTINHTAAMWGYGGSPSLGTLAGQQAGYRRGRLFPVCPSTASGSATIRPYVIPWTPTVDQWGIAFPAGLVGVVAAANLPGTLSGDLNVDLETKWADLAGGSAMVAVPGVLPGGYTPNLHVPWRTAAWDLSRLPTADGWIAKTWLPNATPWGSSIIDFTFWSPTLVASGANSTLRTSWPGWRNLKIRAGGNNGSGPPATKPTSGQCVIRISHNADGSAGASTGDLDTVDATVTITAAQITANYDIVSGAYQSDPIDLGGPFLATFGTLSRFVYRVVSNTLTSGSGGSGPPSFIAGVDPVVFLESYRVDIPYPVTLAGYGDLIAPGGYP